MRTFLPRDARRRSAVLVAVLGLSGAYFVHAYRYAPGMERAEATRFRLSELERLMREARPVPPAEESDPRRSQAEHERHLARLETLIPAREEVASLLESISVVERETGVEVTMLRPEPPEEGELYDRRSYEVMVRGGYHEIASFMTAVASLRWIVVPSDIAIVTDPEAGAARPDASAALVASLRIQTYVASAAEPASASAPVTGNDSTRTMKEGNQEP